MDQVTRVKQYLKKEQWQKLIKDCQNSGMTVKAWLGTVNSFSQIYFSSKVAVFQTHLYEQVQSRMRSIYLSLTELVHTGSLWRAAACS